MARDLYNQTLVDALRGERLPQNSKISVGRARKSERGFFSASRNSLQIEPTLDAPLLGSASLAFGALSKHRISGVVVTHKLDAVGVTGSMLPSEAVDDRYVLKGFDRSSVGAGTAVDFVDYTHDDVPHLDRFTDEPAPMVIALPPAPVKGALSSFYAFWLSATWGVLLSLNFVMVCLVTAHYFKIY